ncbi:hypothetical protein WMY93_028091 [Mugilogobius chulae]|uniref:2-phosphoxylose phosphatase 1 n=1 Tax=Mugilogobius chulae TaxID=88201 RepID=A0AAW0MMC8_9GOBI
MMQARNRFLLLVVGGAAALAVLSLSAQFFNLMPSAAGLEGKQFQAADGASVQVKSRKRVFPAPVSQTEEPEPVSEAYGYCNSPNRSEQAWEGHSPADYRLLSVQVMIRHGDRYPLYSIPKTKRPAIDCTLSANRAPSHQLLTGFISHMSRGGRGHWDSPLSSVPRLPNHSSCDVGELTQTGVVQHLRNGQLLREAYKHRALLPADWSPRQVWVETTGKSRTLQSGLAFLYGLLPDFDWTKVTVRHQWSTLFCSGSCDCPARNKYLDEEQRRPVSTPRGELRTGKNVRGNGEDFRFAHSTATRRKSDRFLIVPLMPRYSFSVCPAQRRRHGRMSDDGAVRCYPKAAT